MINEQVRGRVAIVVMLVISIVFLIIPPHDILLQFSLIVLIVLCIVGIIMMFKPKTKEEMITKMSVKEQVRDLGKKRVGLLVFFVGMLVINIVLLYYYLFQDFTAYIFVGSLVVIGCSIYGIIKMFKPNLFSRSKR